MEKNSFNPQTPFEGYVKAMLENFEKRFDDLPCGETFKRLNSVENKVSNMEGKVTIIGLIGGFFSGLITKYFIR
jgi:hypothetical protein